MRKMIPVVLILSSCIVSVESADGPSGDISAEYRHDILDTEEKETDFYRFRGNVTVSPNTGAFVTAAWVPAEKRKSYTFAFCAAEPSISLAVTGGDYYVRFGSGLLVGHGRPYNPDPFHKEETSYEESGISPCVNGSQSSAFRGFAFSRTISDSLRASVFGSRALRYYSGGDNSSSIGTLLSRPDREGTNTDPVYLRSGGIMLSSSHEYFIIQLSGFYADLSTPSGKRILWESDEDGGGYRSSSGESLYAAYNDGVIRMYIDFALSSVGYMKGGKRDRIYGKAFQSEAVIRKESFMLRLAAKNVGTEYYSPFFSPLGTKTSSNSFFWEAKVIPFDSLSFSSDAAIERKKTVSNFDPEPSSVCREGISVVIKPVKKLSLMAGHRLTGNALESFPERQQFRGGITADFTGYNQIETAYIEQRKAGAISRVFQGQVGIGIARMFTFGVNYAEIRAKTADDVYLSPLPLDGVMVPWIAVNGRAHLASLRVTAEWKGISLHAKGLCVWTGRSVIRRRVEFAARGSW